MNAICYITSLLSFPVASWVWPCTVARNAREHSVCSRCVLAILYVVLAYFQVAQHTLSAMNLVEIWGLSFNAGSAILFPSNLAILLYLYVARSPSEFCRVCVFIAGINALIASTTCIVRLSGGTGLYFSHDSTWVILLGTLILVLDAMFMVAFYGHRICRSMSGLGRIVVPLLAALSLDSLLFSAVISSFRDGSFLYIFVAQLTSKWVFGALYGVILATYLLRRQKGVISQEPEAPGEFLREARASCRPMLKRGLTFLEACVTGGLMEGLRTLKRKSTDTAQEKFLADWNSLVATQRGRWVAYSSDGMVASADSRKQLADLEQRGLLIEQIPSVETEVSLGPDHTEVQVSIDAGDWYEKAQVELLRDWDKLLSQHRKEWGAYGAEGKVAVSPSHSQLERTLQELNRQDVIVFQIVPWQSPKLTRQR